MRENKRQSSLADARFPSVTGQRRPAYGRRAWIGCCIAMILGAVALPVLGADREGCLICHQYRGLSRIAKDGQSISLFYVNPNYFDKALGPHARLKCTDCHLRSEVDHFPHEVKTPVDCTKLCHLESSTNVEIRFSHDGISQMLGKSIHGKDTLTRVNHLLGDPLKPGQAQCLLCHDEPTFRRSGTSWVLQQAPIQRCNSCHDAQLPKDTRYAYWHVHARSEPARSNEDVARLCATCHSNQAVRDAFQLPDATASYLVSFHGKAAQLGNQETAGCLDCHVSPDQNVHKMLAHADSEAPTNSSHLPNTCRTLACHRAAGASISTAAIHLDLANNHGAESYIAILFVLLIVFTFGPSLTMCALKMLHIVIGRHDPEAHHHAQRVQKLMADPATRQKLKRFSVHQRLQHWYLVACFATLVLSGFPIKFADRAWAAWLIGLFGGLSTARLVHRLAGAMLILGLFYHLIYIACALIRRKRQSGHGLIAAIMGLPMMVSPSDMLTMNRLVAYLLGLRRTHPDMGRFNPEEKFEYIGVFWGTVVLGTTGMLMWFNVWTSRHLSGRVLTIAILVHTFEAFLAVLHIGIVHLAGVIFAPGVFPVSKAMFTGDTPAHEMAEAHKTMLDEVEAEAQAKAASAGFQQPPVAPEAPKEDSHA